MNLEALGSIGEFVSSIVVIVTLVYLAIQVRQTKLSVQSSSWQSGITSIIDMNFRLAEDPELLEIFQRGMAEPDSLNSSEQLRLSFLLANLFHIYHKWYLDNEKGLVDESAWRGEEQSMMALLALPGAERWWQEFAVPYTPEFRSYVDARLLEAGNTITPAYRLDEPLAKESNDVV